MTLTHKPGSAFLAGIDDLQPSPDDFSTEDGSGIQAGHEGSSAGFMRVCCRGHVLDLALLVMARLQAVAGKNILWRLIIAVSGRVHRRRVSCRRHGVGNLMHQAYRRSHRAQSTHLAKPTQSAPTSSTIRTAPPFFVSLTSLAALRRRSVSCTRPRRYTSA